MRIDEIINDLRNLRYNKKYRVWKPFMEKYNCQVICEIGVRFGINFKKLIKHHPKEAVAIDIWKDDGVVSRNDKCYLQQQLEEQYQNFKNDMADKSFVKIYRMYSHEAVKHFPDEYFDFIYIDADHTYEGCLQDIHDWYPKLKKGGFLLGDDYKRNTTRTGVKFGVREAVQEFTKENNLCFFEFLKFQWGLVK